MCPPAWFGHSKFELCAECQHEETTRRWLVQAVLILDSFTHDMGVEVAKPESECRVEGKRAASGPLGKCPD